MLKNAAFLPDLAYPSVSGQMFVVGTSFQAELPLQAQHLLTPVKLNKFARHRVLPASYNCVEIAQTDRQPS